MSGFTELMAANFPLETSSGHYELAFVGVSDEGRAIIRLIRFELDGEERSLMDILEQHLEAGAEHAEADPERYATFLSAFGAVFRDIPGGALSEAMPSDIWTTDVLAQKASNFDEFAKALSAKSRLGQFL